MDLSSDPETMNLLSLDTATDHILSMKEDEWRGRNKEGMIVPRCASVKWCSCCLVCRSNTLTDLSEDPEMMSLLSLDTATEYTAPMKGMSGGGKNDGTLMGLCKVVQLLLGLQIKHLDGVV